MSFVAKHIVDPHERLVGVARLHWIYVVVGLFWSGVVLAAGLGLHRLVALYGVPNNFDQVVVFLGHDIGTPALWFVGAFTLVAALLFLVFFIEYLSTEVALTNERVIRKSGLIAIEVQQIDLGEIDAAQIHHGWLGAFLGYGRIFLDCRFVGDINLPAIRKPYRFLTALRKMQDIEKEHKPPPEKV